MGNARLLQELERVDAELLEHQEKKKKKEGDGVARRTTHLPSVDKYEDTKNKRMEEIKRLKRLLEGQQRSLRAVRQQYAAELYSRAELQRFLKQCLLDIRQEIDRKVKPAYAQSFSPRAGVDLALAQKPVELLQSQDRVVSMLYHKAFPVVAASAGSADELASVDVSEEEIREVYANKVQTAGASEQR